MTVNHDVAGSSPAGGANKKDHHTVVFFVGLLALVWGENPETVDIHGNAISCGAVSHDACVVDKRQQGEPKNLVFRNEVFSFVSAGHNII